MKKIMIFAAFAAALSLASCQKEGLNEVVKNDPSAVSESPVFTGTINAGTKTTVDATEGKVSWEATDEITVTDASENSAVYKISNIDENTGSATFAAKEGEAPLGAGPYSATYGTAPATEQTYSATPGKLYMTAQSSTTSLTFTIQCGLLDINLPTRANAHRIAVTGTPTDGSETTYTLTIGGIPGIDATRSYYIAVPAGIYNKIVITGEKGRVCTLTAASGITVAANHIKPLTFDISKLKFHPDGALKGVFSVGPEINEKVHFSKGNLYCSRTSPESNDWTWHFYRNQYDFNSLNSECEYGMRQAKDTDTEIDLFTWGYNATNSVKPTGDESNNVSITSGDLSTREDWGYYFSPDNWRTLTLAEWQYLFNTRTDAAKKVGVATVNDVYGIIILPDTFTDPKTNNGSGAFVPVSTEDPESTKKWTANVYATGGNWEAMESAGAVFLPTAGIRVFGSYIQDVGRVGLYWSSSACDASDAYNVLFDDGVFTIDGKQRSYGVSVRLVIEAE